MTWLARRSHADRLGGLQTLEPKRLQRVRAFVLYLALFLAALIVSCIFWRSSVRGARPFLTGNEPSYLAYSHSLRSFSFDVAASYRDSGGPTKWLPQLTSDQTIATASGAVRSNRLPLLPILLLPAVVASSLTAIRLTMIVVWSVFAHQLWRLLQDLNVSTIPALLAWVLTLLSFPLLGYATAIYPEIPGKWS